MSFKTEEVSAFKKAYCDLSNTVNDINKKDIVNYNFKTAIKTYGVLLAILASGFLLGWVGVSLLSLTSYVSFTSTSGSIAGGILGAGIGSGMLACFINHGRRRESDQKAFIEKLKEKLDAKVKSLKSQILDEFKNVYTIYKNMRYHTFLAIRIDPAVTAQYLLFKAKE